VEVSQTTDQARAREIVEGLRALPGAALPILHALQAEFGAISDDHIRLVAEILNLSRADVFGIVTFYHDFRRHPPGRHVLRLCRAEACQSLGAEALAAHACARLGIAWHGTTADGAVTLEPVFCLGLCASGPAAMLDGRPLGQLDAGRLDRCLEAVR
jgi:formate dehydrogenase subunit gamma